MLLFNYRETYQVTLLDGSVYGNRTMFVCHDSDSLMKLIEELVGVGYCNFNVKRL